MEASLGRPARDGASKQDLIWTLADAVGMHGVSSGADVL